MFLASKSQISIGQLLLRVAFGCFMLVHGIQKIQNFESTAENFPDPIGVGSQLGLILAIFAEAGCSLLLILGLGTRLATIPLAFTMFVALFIVHGGDPWQKQELAAIYLAAYVIIFVTGPGPLSLDALLFARKSETITDD